MPTDDSKKQAKQAASRERVWRLIHRFIKPVFVRRNNYIYDEVNVDGPFLLIANHANNADPIYVGAASPKVPPAFVSSEHLERLGVISKLLDHCFFRLSRSKASQGANTVRSVLKTLRGGRPVVLFAEGDCTWDGVSRSVFPATGKLARASHVPLVTYRLEGNYLAHPRWADKTRRGRVEGKLVHVYSPEELSEMTGEEIDAAINRDIFVNVWQNQRERPVELKCSAPALGLEDMLFICPQCGSVDSLKTKKNTIFCTACGYKNTLDGYGFFTDKRFPTVREWDEWQQSRSREALCAESGQENTGIFAGRGVLTVLEGSVPEAKGKKQKIGFVLDAGIPALLIGKNKNARLRIPFSEINNMAMVKTNRLLFSTKDSYYEIFSKRGKLRPYLMMWQLFPGKTEEQ